MLLGFLFLFLVRWNGRLNWILIIFSLIYFKIRKLYQRFEYDLVQNNVVIVVTFSVPQWNNNIFTAVEICMSTVQKNKVNSFLLKFSCSLVWFLADDILIRWLTLDVTNFRLNFVQILDENLLNIERTDWFGEILAF